MITEMISSLRDSVTPFKFDGSTCDVLKAYNKDGSPSWLDDNGELIEGIYIGMENEVYHALPAYSSSQLKLLVKKSPAHFYRKYISDIDRGRTVSKSLQRTYDAGTYGHELILEPHGFYDRYYRDIVPADYPNAIRTVAEMHALVEKLNIPDVPKSAKKDRLMSELLAVDPTLQFWDTVLEEHNSKTSYKGKTAIDAIVWDDAHRVHETCRDNLDADALIQDGLPEISFIARCPETGLWLKCRFDWLRFDCIAVDVKTTLSTDPDAFAKQAGNLGYHIQEAFYTYVASLLEVNLGAFIFACIEYVDADLCEVYDLERKDESMIKFKEGLHTLATCLSTGVWTKRVNLSGITSITIPKYCR